MFQFTHPGKGATRVLGVGRRVACCFNSRTLGRVRHIVVLAVLAILTVSIHAPWEGCDSGNLQIGSSPTCFNSRTLGRVRQGHHSPPVGRATFQFTHPGKGATYEALLSSAPEETFQFTHPGKGATPFRLSPSRQHPCFNSRTLGRVRLTLICGRSHPKLFQFTHPGKGATA